MSTVFESVTRHIDRMFRRIAHVGKTSRDARERLIAQHDIETDYPVINAIASEFGQLPMLNGWETAEFSHPLVYPTLYKALNRIATELPWKLILQPKGFELAVFIPFPLPQGQPARLFRLSDNERVALIYINEVEMFLFDIFARLYANHKAEIEDSIGEFFDLSGIAFSMEKQSISLDEKLQIHGRIFGESATSAALWEHDPDSFYSKPFIEAILEIYIKLASVERLSVGPALTEWLNSTYGYGANRYYDFKSLGYKMFFKICTTEMLCHEIGHINFDHLNSPNSFLRKELIPNHKKIIEDVFYEIEADFYFLRQICENAISYGLHGNAIDQSVDCLHFISMYRRCISYLTLSSYFDFTIEDLEFYILNSLLLKEAMISDSVLPSVIVNAPTHFERARFRNISVARLLCDRFPHVQFAKRTLSGAVHEMTWAYFTHTLIDSDGMRAQLREVDVTRHPLTGISEEIFRLQRFEELDETTRAKLARAYNRDLEDPILSQNPIFSDEPYAQEVAQRFRALFGE